MKHAGFTGTKEGMTQKQQDTVRRLLVAYRSVFRTFHEGDCVGADVEAAAIAKECDYIIHCHPPLRSSHRGFFPADVYEEPRPYLVRDQHIVNASELLIATPKGFVEGQRSGTWTTWRYAMKKKRKVITVYPDGTHKEY